MAPVSHILSIILLSLNRLSSLSLFFIFNYNTTFNPMMQALYSIVLLVHSNYNLIKTRYCLPLGELSLILPHCHIYLLLRQSTLFTSLVLLLFLLPAHLHLRNKNSKAHNLKLHCLPNDQR